MFESATAICTLTSPQALGMLKAATSSKPPCVAKNASLIGAEIKVPRPLAYDRSTGSHDQRTQNWHGIPRIEQSHDGQASFYALVTRERCSRVMMRLFGSADNCTEP